MSRFTLFFSSCVITLVGCSTPAPTPLTAQGIAGLKGKSLSVVIPASKTNFTAFTPGKAAFGLLGDQAMQAEGKRIVSENNVIEPTEPLAQALATALRTRLGSPAPASIAVSQLDDSAAAAISAQAGNNQLVLYVQTHDWRTWYYTGNFSRYRARIDVSARLIDATTKTEIARARCDEDSPKVADASPTYDEMTGAGAQRLKQELAKAQAACVATLQKGLLGS
jgi:hypothetical protein